MLETQISFSEQFEEWTLGDHAPFPTRSELYHMLPAGLGTSFIESLTSYIARLAESHCLTTRSLVVQKFFPSLGRSYLSGQRGHDSITAFWKDTPTLNRANIWNEQKVVSPPEELASQVTSVLIRGLVQALPAFPLK
jgi:hypothetical protein